MLRPKIQECALLVVELLYALVAFAPQLRKCRNTLQSPDLLFHCHLLCLFFRLSFMVCITLWEGGLNQHSLDMTLT